MEYQPMTKSHAQICNDLYDRFLAAKKRLAAAECLSLISIATIDRLNDEAGDAYYAFEIEMANDTSPSFVEPTDLCCNCGGDRFVKNRHCSCTCVGPEGVQPF
jgi:hypothetical protein